MIVGVWNVFCFELTNQFACFQPENGNIKLYLQTRKIGLESQKKQKPECRSGK